MKRSDSPRRKLLPDNEDDNYLSDSSAERPRLHIKSQVDCHDCTDGIPTFNDKAKKEEVDPAYRTAQRKLIIASIFVLIFMSLEFAAGIIANSLAILSDAAHMFSDLAAFLISIGALMLTRRGATEKLTFGWHRAEILGVLVSILLIWALTGALVYEGIQRVQDPPDVNGPIVTGTAIAGLFFNLIIMAVLQGAGHGHSHGGDGGGHGHSHGHGNGHSHNVHGTGSINAPAAHRRSSGSSAEFSDSDSTGDGDGEMNINVRAAWIHALGDVIQSIGVIIAGVIIWVKPEWSIADPICTFVFSVLILFTTVRILGEAVSVLMAGTPEGISPRNVEEDLMTVAGVLAVHDLHIWNLTRGKPLCSVHVVIDYHDPDQTLEEVRRLLNKKYKISHSTVQMERAKEQGVPTSSDHNLSAASSSSSASAASSASRRPREDPFAARSSWSLQDAEVASSLVAAAESAAPGRPDSPAHAPVSLGEDRSASRVPTTLVLDGHPGDSLASNGGTSSSGDAASSGHVDVVVESQARES